MIMLRDGRRRVDTTRRASRIMASITVGCTNRYFEKQRDGRREVEKRANEGGREVRR